MNWIKKIIIISITISITLILDHKYMETKKISVTKPKSSERKIAYWKAPMNPAEIYDKPGKSAMGMDLVPVYEDENTDGSKIKISPVMKQNMGIRIAAARVKNLSHKISTYGHITYDESKIFEINQRYSGWIEKLYISYKGEHIKKGAPLFSIYSPELITAEQEYVNALKNSRYIKSRFKIVESSKRRLMNFDLPVEFINNLKKRQEVEQSIIIKSNASGIIIKKNILQGGYFKSGDTLLEIADISNVWVEAHIYDYEIALIKKGMPVTMTLPYTPGKIYKGKVSFIYPYVEKQTRDVIVRFEFPNKNNQLKPDMYADISLIADQGKGIVVPYESIIRSGGKKIVFVEKGKGEFEPRKVITGFPVNDNEIHIIKGIAEGEKIVRSGQFMLDSESNLNESVNKMSFNKEDEKDSSSQTEDNSFFEDME